VTFLDVEQGISRERFDRRFGYIIESLYIPNSTEKFEVAEAGDLNSDNISDIAISFPGAFNRTGLVYIVYGGSIVDIDLDVITVQQRFKTTHASLMERSG
jgi:hypothetical protein